MGLYPEGLIDSIERTLIQCQNAAKDISPAQLLKEALDHFEKVQEASGNNSHIDVQTAEAIVGVFLILVQEWDSIPSIAQSWCKAMMRYFTIADDIENDFNSPIGFDDDAEVVNACLKLAGRADICLDVEAVQEKPKLSPKPKAQKSTAQKTAIAPGMRVLCRDAEWLVTRVNITGHEPIAYQVHCVGADDLVRGHEAIFLSQLDDITPVDPRQTRLVADISNGYQLSKLFMGARLRQMPAVGIEPDFNGMGVFRPMAFQKETVRRALHQLRPRLLLADAVGLGKTIQVGMILTELLRRGRANRILVLTKKSMLTQFQAELWNRFSIPLVRLDSTGIARLRLRIPANKNPFEVYHRVIISLDTLKNVGRYEHFLKDTHWDVVIIDEAHNVAGASIPERNLSYRLARQLARRTNSILLTTATPHNGKRETFGRLISLLDPSVIPDPAFREYSRDDIKHFILMRFKEDARADAGEMLTERQVIPISQTTANASPEEEEIYKILGELRQASATVAEGADHGCRQHAIVEAPCPSPSAPVLNASSWQKHPMVQYVLYKLFLSSPEACAVTVRKRIQHLRTNEPDSPEMPYLQRLHNHLDKLDITRSSRYRLLVKALGDIGWTGRADSPRVLVFTESPRTQLFMAPALARDFNIAYSARFEDQAGQSIAAINGSTPDSHLMDTVEAFGTGSASVRLLIATEVASEGINLHHQCHHIIHYDLPWSIITLIQRNGRIDRIGQKHPPQLRYLMVHTEQGILKGDSAIFQRLIEKVEEINRLRQSGESILQLYDPEAEEAYIANQGILANDSSVLNHQAPEASPESAALEAMLREASQAGNDEYLDFLLGAADTPTPESTSTPSTSQHSPRWGEGFDLSQSMAGRLRLFSDREFLLKGYAFLREKNPDYPPIEDHGGFIALTAPEDLKRRLGAPGSKTDVVFGATAIPMEAWPKNGEFRLTDDTDRVNLAIEAARNTSGYWARELFCNEAHPIQQWITERLVMEVKRDEAPFVVTDRFDPGELCFCFMGQVSSVAGSSLIVDAHAVSYGKKGLIRRLPLEEALAAANFQKLANTGESPNLEAAHLLMHAAVAESLLYLKHLLGEREKQLQPLLKNEERRLRNWRNRRQELLEAAIHEIGPNHPKAQQYRRLLDEMAEYLKDRQQNWRDTHFRAASEPSTQLLLVIGGKA